MNLAYNILWIENEVDWYKASKDLINYIIEEEGFILKSTHKKSEEEIEELIQINGLQSYDLILIDFNLDNGDTGSAIIETIRDNQIFTDILFYSQNFEGIKDAIRTYELEGVYLSKRDREYFEQKFEKVFKTTIKKIQDISSVRGLVLAETAKLDRKIELIILKYCESASEENRERIINYISNKIFISSKSSFQKADKLRSESNIKVLIKERMFDSYKKMHTLGEIIELTQLEFINKGEFIENYNDQVINIRNILAHVEEFEDDLGIKKLKAHESEIIFDDEKCKEMRMRLIHQDQILNKVNSALSKILVNN